jgi:nucleoside 2-deoxyribosyltransferase
MSIGLQVRFMYYHALIRTEGGGFTFSNMSFENLLNDVLIPYINSQVKLVDYRNSEKVLVNYGSASYLRIAKSKEKIFEGFQIAGALPRGAEDCTKEIIEETQIENSHQNRKSLLQMSFLPNKKQVFVIMKFGDEKLDSTYNFAIKPVIEEFGYQPLRIDQVENSGKINDQILEEIAKSEVILADLTDEKPNCYFEVGIALALEKNIILTINKISKKHFDLESHRFIEWETDYELKEKLLNRFKAIKEKKPIIEINELRVS